MCSARYSKQCRGFGDCAGSPGLAFSLSQAATSVQRLLTCACRLCHLPAATSAVCLSLAVPQEKWKHLTAPEEPVEKQPKPCKPHVWWSEEDTDAAAQILGQLGKVLAGDWDSYQYLVESIRSASQHFLTFGFSSHRHLFEYF